MAQLSYLSRNTNPEFFIKEEVSIEEVMKTLNQIQTMIDKKGKGGIVQTKLMREVKEDNLIPQDKFQSYLGLMIDLGMITAVYN